LVFIGIHWLSLSPYYYQTGKPKLSAGNHGVLGAAHRSAAQTLAPHRGTPVAKVAGQ